MGATRVVLPFFLIVSAVVLCIVAFVSFPPGKERTILLAASWIDFVIGLGFLLFGVPNRR